MVKKTIIRKNSKPNPLPIKQEKFEFPQSLLSQLEEFTDGGYILITAPLDGQVPEVRSSFDSGIYDVWNALFARDYFAASNKNMAKMTDDFLGATTS